MTLVERVARELYRWSYYDEPTWDKAFGTGPMKCVKEDCRREARRIVKMCSDYDKVVPVYDKKGRLKDFAKRGEGKALHDFEWVLSGDYAPGDEFSAIRKVLGIKKVPHA